MATDAVVVGSGPNGLTAANVLADAGCSVVVLEAAATPGGGCRSAELTLPGFVHDVCSAIHPFGSASPAFAGLDLHAHGLRWVHPELDVVHPLDGGRAGMLHRSVEETDTVNGGRWKRVFGAAVRHWPDLAPDFLRDPLHVPRHPLAYVRFGLQCLPPATTLARALGDDRAAALWMGIAAHLVSSLRSPLSAAAGTGFIAAGHNTGWPAASGGSQQVTDALVARLRSKGGSVETGCRVRNLGDLPPARVALFDTTPTQLVRIAGDTLPPRTFRRYRHAPGTFKIDYALDGPVPWTSNEARRAGTVHVGGTAAEVDAAEQTVHRGRIADRPLVVVAQQSLFDETRAPAGQHTLWAYCHVPHGCDVDVSHTIEGQLDRFAPGWRDRVLARHVSTPAALETYNENYVGGDIIGGANDGLRWLFRPRLALDPYRTPARDVYLCSSSTPPGAGVHGMCGWWAARSALARL